MLKTQYLTPKAKANAARARTRRRYGRSPKALGEKELAMLRAGASLDSVLLSFFGGDVQGAAWQHRVGRMLECGELATGELHTSPVRHNDDTERKTLAWVIIVMSRIRRKGARLVSQTKELYQPAIAARLGLSVKGVQRRTKIAEVGGVLKRWQPPSSSTDALMPRSGDWSFLEYIPSTALPPVLLQKLRRAWGEISQEPSSAPSPPRVSPPPAPSSAPRSGAPPPPLGNPWRANPEQDSVTWQGAELVLAAAKARQAVKRD
jgi:hypothetical protein